MEDNFFYDNEFYSDLDSLICHISGEDDLSDLEDDWSIDCYYSKLEPVFELTAWRILQSTDEGRWPEDEENIYNKIEKLLNDNINFEYINKNMPKLYYETKEKFIITKQELLDYINE